MKSDNWLIIVVFILLFSVFINVSQHLTIESLKYRILKLEAGPPKGLFNKTDESVGDRMLKRLIEKMLMDMENKKLRDNTT